MEKIEDEIVEMKVMLARIEERLVKIQDDLDRDFKTLYGNGKPGVLERITKLEERQSSVWATIKSLGGFILSILSMGIALYAATRGGH